MSKSTLHSVFYPLSALRSEVRLAGVRLLRDFPADERAGEPGGHQHPEGARRALPADGPRGSAANGHGHGLQAEEAQDTSRGANGADSAPDAAPAAARGAAPEPGRAARQGGPHAVARARGKPRASGGVQQQRPNTRAQVGGASHRERSRLQLLLMLGGTKSRFILAVHVFADNRPFPFCVARKNVICSLQSVKKRKKFKSILLYPL